jgi:hypothetical protein
MGRRVHDGEKELNAGSRHGNRDEISQGPGALMEKVSWSLGLEVVFGLGLLAWLEWL